MLETCGGAGGVTVFDSIRVNARVTLAASSSALGDVGLTDRRFSVKTASVKTER